jgi:hypothetical protein
MTEQELHQMRRAKWRLTGHPVRTLEEAATFLESVGFCLMYPMRPPMPLPTFMGAFVGADDHLPALQHAYADARATEATELMVRMLRQRAAYEANFFEDNNAFLVSASIFPYFYALVGERNPKLAPTPRPHSDYSQLACDAYGIIEHEGPISRQKLQNVLRGGVSAAGLDHALGELWSRLRITRVDYKSSEGAFWDVLQRWAPEPVREGISLSVGSSLSALLSKYLECRIAADLEEVETFFANFVPRSRIKEAVNALLATRELSFVYVGKHTLLHVTPPRAERVPGPTSLRTAD